MTEREPANIPGRGMSLQACTTTMLVRLSSAIALAGCST
jgi:hypothetical protein